MKKGNINNYLYNARANKKDEFYTQMKDIKKELAYYKEQFDGKVIYCNCDDPRESNFVKYFISNFKTLNLKKLIASSYKSQEYNLFDMREKEKASWLEYNGNLVDGKVPEASELELKYFKGNGDFRSRESIRLLKQADIVVTNPPFSLFREFITQMIEYDKKFLVLGNLNAITYKEFFPLIMNGKVWPGNVFNVGMKFKVPKDYPLNSKESEITKEGHRLVRVPALTWWTNIDYNKRHKDMKLTKFYKGNEHKYPKYNNSDIINIDKTKNIPKDYQGIMGVPITFLSKYNPDQFEIVGMCNSGRWTGIECYAILGERNLYHRLLLKNKRL